MNTDNTRAATIFSCHLQELIQLMEAGSSDGENGQENGASAFGEVVTMGARFFLDGPRALPTLDPPAEWLAGGPGGYAACPTTPHQRFVTLFLPGSVK